MRLTTITILSLTTLAVLTMADSCQPTSDDIQRDQQEKILAEGTAQTGMPAIKNFRERKLLKDILEMRDQDGLLTYTYIVAENSGKLVFIGETVGYGIPYATEYTNPQKIDKDIDRHVVLPQADPNGLFSPASADGTWVMMKVPGQRKVVPVYIEPRIIVSPFPLGNAEAAARSN